MSQKRNASQMSDQEQDNMPNKKQAATKAPIDEDEDCLRVRRDDTATYSTSPMVDIRVCGGIGFYVHKALLETYSPYLAECLESDSTKGKDLQATLLEENDDTFDFFVQWLYHGNLGDVIQRGDFVDVIMDLYELAEKLMVPALKNMTVDVYRRRLKQLNEFENPKHILKLFDAGLLNSKLGEFMLRSFVYVLCDDNAKANYAPESYQEQHAAAIASILKRSKILRVVTTYLLEFQKKPWGDPRYAEDGEFHEYGIEDEGDGEASGKSSNP